MRFILSIILSLNLLLNISFADALPFDGTHFIKAGAKETISGKANINLISSIDVSIGPGLIEILKVLYAIGDAVALCILGYMGITFIISPPQQKAQLKASLFPYFYGLLFYMAGVPLAVAIINIIIELF